MNENSQCTNYVLFKENLQMEDYLVQLEDEAKYIIEKFRTRMHHLPVTNNRFIRDNAKDSTCPLCNRGEVGDEFHYLQSVHILMNVEQNTSRITHIIYLMKYVCKAS